MSYPHVNLIGGAPMSGKTTVAHRLAAILGYGCLSTDDLGAAIRAVTTKDSHPHLHPMDGYDYREYYVTHSPDELIADAILEHRALWPAVQSVIRAHGAWGKPIVIEGWSLWPERVVQLRLPSVRSLWFVAHESTLQERMVNAVSFYGGASDEAAMMGHYLARSLWYNARLKEEDKVIVQRDGNDGKSELLAVNGKSGATVWQTARPSQRESWSTPTIWSDAGQDELLVIGNGRLVAYSPKDGTERWWVRGLSIAPITMAVSGDGLIFASSKSIAGAPGDRLELPTWDALLQYDKNNDGKVAEDEFPADMGIQLRKDVPKETPGNLMPIRDILTRRDLDKDKAISKSEWEGLRSFMETISDVIVAVRPGGKGDSTTSHVAWTASRGIAEMPSPLFYRGRLYLVRDGGMVTSYEPATGKIILDRQRLGVLGQYVASPVAADGRIYAASETGTVVVFRAGDSLEVLARNELGEGIRATPAIAANKLYVRTLNHLWAFGN